jgi:hypothetical protein
MKATCACVTAAAQLLSRSPFSGFGALAHAIESRGGRIFNRTHAEEFKSEEKTAEDHRIM